LQCGRHDMPSRSLSAMYLLQRSMLKRPCQVYASLNGRRRSRTRWPWILHMGGMVQNCGYSPNSHKYIIIYYMYLYILRKPASWLVAVCERSENRGCGGGGCRKGTKSRRAPVLSARKRSILLDYVPLCNLLTVGYRFPLGPPFWWPERP